MTILSQTTISDLPEYLVRSNPEVAPEVVRHLTREVTKELWALTLQESLRERDAGNLERWGALRGLASEFFEAGS